MNYKELLKILQKNPNEAFCDSQNIKPFEGGILLVEKHEMNFGNCGNHIWFFRTPKEFVDFLPALLLPSPFDFLIRKISTSFIVLLPIKSDQI